MSSSSYPPSGGAGAIERFMIEDHRRLDGLLDACELADGSVEPDLYAALRRDLLRHIGLEEQILLRFARVTCGCDVHHVATALRADHGEIAKLLVPPPTPTLLASLRAVLERHDSLEGGPRCFYSACDDLAGDDAAAVLALLRDALDGRASDSVRPHQRALRSDLMSQDGVGLPPRPCALSSREK